MNQQIFRILADLRFSIFILLLISLFSITGTVIEQDQTIETYKLNYPLSRPIFGILSWDKILELGLDHVYKTWWFLALVLLFGSSLLLCSFFQQLPSLKIARRCQFFRITEQFYKLKISTILNETSFNRIVSEIKLSKYSIFQQKNIIYCYKGLIGRIAPIAVHFSMIFVLIGLSIGSVFGYKAQEVIPNTENFHIQNLLSNGPLAQISQTTARINHFWIIYTKEKTIAQFYSDLSILNKNGVEVNQKTIRVNQPLVYKGTYYYQTDWNLIGLRLQNSSEEIVEYPLTHISNRQSKLWLTWYSERLDSNQGSLLLIDNLEGYCSVYKETGEFTGTTELNETTNIFAPISLVEIISSTGLQIKRDPGIIIIYLGFLSLMISTLISYITYSQVWIIENNKQAFIGGTTNRAIFEFELEFLKFAK